VTRVKNKKKILNKNSKNIKKIQKNQKLTCVVDLTPSGQS